MGDNNCDNNCQVWEIIPESCVSRAYQRCDQEPRRSPTLECRKVSQRRCSPGARRCPRSACRQVIMMMMMVMKMLTMMMIGALDILQQGATQDKLQDAAGDSAETDHKDETCQGL